MELFARDELVTFHEMELAGARGPDRLRHLAALAWYLRQSDGPQSLRLAGEAAEWLDHSPLSSKETRRTALRIALARGEAHWLKGELAAAYDIAQEAAEGFAALSDGIGTGDALHLKANVFHGWGQIAERDQALSQMVELWWQAGDERRASYGEATIGFHKTFTNIEEAETVWARLVPQPDEPAGHPMRDTQIGIFWGWLAFAHGDYGRAAAVMVRPIEQARSCGMLFNAIGLTVGVGIASGYLNDYDGALEWQERGLEMARRQGWPAMIGLGLAQVSHTLGCLGRRRQALTLSQEALHMLAPFEGSRDQVTAMLFHGELLLEDGRTEDAFAILKHAEGGARRLEANHLLGRVLCRQAHALNRLHRSEDAETAAEEALRIARVQRNGIRQIDALRALAAIRRDAGVKPAALDQLLQALALARTIRGFQVPSALLDEIAAEYAAAGNFKSAYEAAQEASSARETTHSRAATNRAVALGWRHENEKARIEAEQLRQFALVEAQRAADAAAASRAKSDFLAAMSHEIRTPLNGILGMASLLIDSEMSADQRQRLQVILASGQALLGIVNDVLDISKIEAGAAELDIHPFDLHQLLNELWDLMGPAAAAKKLEFTLDLAADLPRRAAGDNARLRQVLVNLIGNAIKFTKAGRIELRARAAEPLADPFLLEITVRDTGVGIPIEARPRLFQSFAQVDQSRDQRLGGSGLGLAICRRIVDLMGGDIGFESEVERGSEFWFRVSMAHDQSPSEIAPPQRIALDRPLSILVAEDNEVNQIVVREMLERAGHYVQLVGDGRAALEAVIGGSFDVVLMDLQMPDMGGLEATAAIRALNDRRRARVPVIAVTANALAEERNRCLAGGMNDYVTKPFQREELLDRIARVAVERSLA